MDSSERISFFKNSLFASSDSSSSDDDDEEKDNIVKAFSPINRRVKRTSFKKPSVTKSTLKVTHTNKHRPALHPRKTESVRDRILNKFLSSNEISEQPIFQSTSKSKKRKRKRSPIDLKIVESKLISGIVSRAKRGNLDPPKKRRKTENPKPSKPKVKRDNQFGEHLVLDYKGFDKDPKFSDYKGTLGVKIKEAFSGDDVPECKCDKDVNGVCDRIVMSSFVLNDYCSKIESLRNVIDHNTFIVYKLIDRHSQNNNVKMKFK